MVKFSLNNLKRGPWGPYLLCFFASPGNCPNYGNFHLGPYSSWIVCIFAHSRSSGTVQHSTESSSKFNSSLFYEFIWILKYGGKLRWKFCAKYLACILHKILLTTCSLVNQVLKFLFRVHWNWVKTFHRQLEALQSTNSNCQHLKRSSLGLLVP